MSVPYNIRQQKEEASERLMISASGNLAASARIPMIARPFVSDRAKKMLDVVCNPGIKDEVRQY